MTTSPTQTPPSITARLAKLRRMIRFYVAAEGAGLCIAITGALFWFSLAFDWLFEPTKNVRLVGLGLLAAILLFFVYRHLARRLLAKLSDQNMAALLERRYASLNDHLLTAVELAGDAPPSSAAQEMLRHTKDHAATLAEQTSLSGVFRRAPLFRSLALSCVALLSVGMFTLFSTDAFGTWFNRTILLTDDQWPRDAEIFVDGFTLDKVTGRRIVKVARGSDLKLHARANNRRLIPEVMEVHYESESLSSRTGNMSRLGTAVIGRDDFQKYSYVFQNIQSDIHFDVAGRNSFFDRNKKRFRLGKDALIRDLWILAVDSPRFEQVSLLCKYPEYLDRKEELLPVTGVMSLPEGTEVTIQATSTKDLVTAQASWGGGEDDVQGTLIRPEDDTPRKVHLPLGPLSASTAISFALKDTDGVFNGDPIRVQIDVVIDEPPKVDLRIVGVGSAITPQARVPYEGTIEDDHGITQTSFDVRIGTQAPVTVPFGLPENGQFPKSDPVALDLIPLGLQPGQKLLVAATAADNFDLASEPHQAASQRTMLDVVTESQLRALLESRELILRFRFQQIIEQLNQTRDTLARLETGDVAIDEETAEESPGDEAAASAPDPQRVRSLWLLRARECQQNAQNNGHEIADIAVGFDSILLELKNNRVSQIQKLEQRLQDDIADPMRILAAARFPPLVATLSTIAESPDTPEEAAAQILAADAQIETILQEMDVILGKMKELASFNEVLARLREIIEANQRTATLTKERREQLKRERLKNLLGE